MSGTPFETLLEPISQPALGHEIVIGLIKAERTMRSHHWNKRAWHIPKSNLPGTYRFAYHEIDRLIARLVCVAYARSKAALQGGCKKLSREDDRKEGQQARRLRARRWAPGCCCGMRSRRTEPSIDAGSDPAQELTPPVTTRTIVVPERLRHESGQSSVPSCRPLGGNIRVGLEDSLWMDPGKLAKSHAE